ncbi:cyclin-dependent kinase-like 2 isoform X2 [Heptranchias perlo]|uniref:cyclin-dependent kinase-like 2 isoform X2 n=1 Tax=Heptranchias perlo TaxID=212740 RepID=UPI003559A5C1
MEKYENLGLVGEGSYGTVMKCRNKESGRIVAIKKFLDGDDDKMVKKIAMREIRLLKQLRHENLVHLLEVCKKKKRWYLVFEFVDHTVLDDLEQFPNGLEYGKVRKYLIQVLRGMAFCHSHNIIHRDIKPENILVSQSGVVKLCDFGFARTLAAPGEIYTDYVATRWYRAPELLVGDTKYGKSVDVWAVGCLVTEMLTGEPLFPGDSDIDQLYQIIKCFGNLTPRHQGLFYKNPLFAGLHLPEIKEIELLQNRYPKIPFLALDLVKKCLQIDPDKRPSCAELLEHDYFTKDGFSERFTQELGVRYHKDLKDNLPLPKRSKIGKKELEELPEDQKKSLTNSKGEDAESRTKETKSDGKLPKTKASKVESEKAAKLERAVENVVDGGTFRDLGPNKVISQGLVKDRSAGFDRPKSPAGTVIPPITQNPPTLNPAALSVNVNSGVGVSGQPNFWVNNKMKKHTNPLRTLNQPLPINLFSVYVNGQLQQEKAERPVQLERVGLTSKKKWEAFKSEKEDVHFPELSSSNHLPELKAAEAKHSKMRKESRKILESKIPSLAAMDLYHQPSLASQSSLNSLQEAAESNFPRVKQLP